MCFRLFGSSIARIESPRLRIRLLGLKLSNLGFYDQQLELFERHERLDGAVDDVRAKFGFDAIGSGSALEP